MARLDHPTHRRGRPQSARLGQPGSPLWVLGTAVRAPEGRPFRVVLNELDRIDASWNGYLVVAPEELAKDDDPAPLGTHQVHTYGIDVRATRAIGPISWLSTGPSSCRFPPIRHAPGFVRASARARV
jgi:hypothetical protein